MTSNIQSVESMNTPSMRSTISYLKNELKKSENNDIKNNNIKTFSSTLCKNALTNTIYTFEKGSSEEKELYRVMPLDGSEKIYFDSEDEYKTWSKNVRKKQSKL